MSETFIISTGGQAFAVKANNHKAAIIKAFKDGLFGEAELGILVSSRKECDSVEHEVYTLVPKILLEIGLMNQAEYDEIMENFKNEPH